MITPAYSPTATERVLPRLALDFTTGVLDPRVTVTRALDTATRVNSSGYIEQVNANLPRFDYNPSTLAARGLLIEESRANLILYSEQLDATGWNLTAASIGADAATSPANTLTADRLIENSAASVHNVARTFATTAGVAYTQSIFAKMDTRRYISLGMGAANAVTATFDLQAGTVSGAAAALGSGWTGPSATITPFGNGWYRCTITGTDTVGTTRTFHFALSNVGTTASSGTGNSYTGDGTSSAFMWGAQVEAGAFATSYIPTTTTSLTRNADVVSMTGTNFSDWYNASEGAFVVDAFLSANIDGVVGNYYMSASDGTINNTMHIADVNGTVSQIITSGSTQFSQTVGSEPNGATKAAFAYKLNSAASAANGTSGTTDTTVSLPTVDRLTIGGRGDLLNQAFLNGYVRGLRFYNPRIINAELAAFTK